MRTQRAFFKPKNEGVYLHIYNHSVALQYGELPFNDTEKENFTRIVEKQLLKYNIDLISLVLMGNHFHMLLYCHPQKLSPKEAVKRYQKYRNLPKKLEEDHPRIQSVIKHSDNVSEFMREVQGEFSKWFNKTRPYKRHGALWQDRFQTQLIQSDVYLWSCLSYVEQNPVRAGICQDPADYKFSSFGRWSNNQQHPYKHGFLKHVLSLAGNQAKLNDFKKYMHTKMKIDNLQRKIEITQNNQEKACLQKALDQEIETLYSFDFQVITVSKKDWKSKKVIGSDEFIREKYREWQEYRRTA